MDSHLAFLICGCVGVVVLLLFAPESSDEVGFIHPSQFVKLYEETGHFRPTTSSRVLQPTDDASYHGTAMLWSKDHKLGISTHILLPLFKMAKHAFMDAVRRYKALNMLNSTYNEIRIESSPCTFSYSPNSVESEVMKHSRAVLLLSSDFGTAWHSRFCPLLYSWFWVTHY